MTASIITSSKKSKQLTSVRRNMANVFWDPENMLLIDVIDCSDPVAAGPY
jgi:hypothetical protein